MNSFSTDNLENSIDRQVVVSVVVSVVVVVGLVSRYQCRRERM